MTRMLAIAAVPVVLVAVLAASASASTDDPIIVTRDGPLPSGCTPRETVKLLIRLADAVNAGDERAIDRLFAIEDPPGRHVDERAEPFFRWYSVGAVAMYDRAELFPYFAERRRHDERWELIGVDVGTSWVRGGAGIGYVLHRNADDLPSHAAEFARGKGEIDCAAQRIYVWSMAQGDRRQRDDGLPSCPRPSGWTPGTAVIACARSAKDMNAAGLTPRAFAPDFRIVEGAVDLPRRCSPTFAAGKLRSALTAFNKGLGKSFAKHFVPRRAYFHPYTVDEQDVRGPRLDRPGRPFATRRRRRVDGDRAPRAATDRRPSRDLPPRLPPLEPRNAARIHEREDRPQLHVRPRADLGRPGARIALGSRV